MERARVRVLRALLLTGSLATAVVVAPLAAGAATRTAGTFSGEAFDSCTLPSTTQLKAWSSSPYRAFNVYIGGVNAACPHHPGATWTKSVTALGWALIPTFVGLQAPGNSCGCAAIVASKAASEGAGAANQAVKELTAMGIGTGNVVYYDMEGYPTGSASNTVLTFLAAWTKKLHALGYISGVYSSAGSGISDLASKYGTSYLEPDDIWIADWNGQKTVEDPTYVPNADWANVQRLHQYLGNQTLTYGGVTLSLDSDYCDGAAVTAASL